MNNWGNIIKGWKIVFLCVIFSFGVSDVLALEVIEEEALVIEEIEKEEEGQDSSVADYKIDLEVELDDVEDNIKQEDVVVDVKTREEIFNDYSDNLDFSKDKVMVNGNIGSETLVSDIISKIYLDELIINYGELKIGITDEVDKWLNDDEVVTNRCHLVIIGTDFVTRYQIQFQGDLNQDNLITEEDVEVGVDKFFEVPELEQEETILTEEISYIDAVVRNDTYVVQEPVIEEEIVGNLEFVSDDEVYVDDEISIYFGIEGLENNYINTISGMVDYDHEVLELRDVYVLVDGKIIGKYLNNKFIYVLDNYKNNEYFLVFIFKGLNGGNSYISLKNLKVGMNGCLLEIKNDDSLMVGVLEYGKGGDDYTPPVVEETTQVVSPVVSENKAVILTPKREDKELYQGVTTVLLSNDNYIKKLDIKGYDILFDKDINRYSIVVDSNVSKLNLNVLLNDDNASYFITGNEKFKEGKNEIILTVFAENGSSRDYVIEVNKKGVSGEENDTRSEDESELKRITLFTILVIMIITIIWIIYRVLKQDY